MVAVESGCGGCLGRMWWRNKERPNAVEERRGGNGVKIVCPSQGFATFDAKMKTPISQSSFPDKEYLIAFVIVHRQDVDPETFVI